MVSRRVDWSWHRHLGDEAGALKYLDASISGLEDELEAKKLLRQEIINRATARARKAGDRVKPWTLSFDPKEML